MKTPTKPSTFIIPTKPIKLDKKTDHVKTEKQTTSANTYKPPKPLKPPKPKSKAQLRREAKATSNNIGCWTFVIIAFLIYLFFKWIGL